MPGETKYKHDEIVRAWLDGKTVQRKEGTVWVDVSLPLQHAQAVPMFLAQNTYRIKPNPKTLGERQYRRYLCYNSSPQTVNGVAVVNMVYKHYTPVTISSVETDRRFIKWIDTDWQDHEW